MSDKELILSFLNDIKADLVSDLRAKNISDGDLDMETAATDEDGNLSGAEYYYYVVHGRRPGKRPPIDSILEWIQKKGIHADDISDRSLAFLIARKIGNVGTDIYTGKRPGLALEEILAKNEEKFNKDLADKKLAEMIELLDESFNKIFKA